MNNDTAATASGHAAVESDSSAATATRPRSVLMKVVTSAAPSVAPGRSRIGEPSTAAIAMAIMVVPMTTDTVVAASAASQPAGSVGEWPPRISRYTRMATPQSTVKYARLNAIFVRD